MDIIRRIYFSFTQKERQILWGSIAVFFVAGTLWTITFFKRTTIEVPVQSTIYREGVIGQPVSINPILGGANDADRDLITLLFSDLITLSESHRVSEDGQVWNVALKPNLLWSNDKPLTSDDVVFTIDAIQNSGGRSPLFPTWQGVIVDRISEREVEFTLRTPYAFFFENLKNLRIAPKHIFGAIPPENFYLSGYNLEPVGSGPYRFSSLEKRRDGFVTSYRLVTNKNFPLEKPYLREFEIRFYQNENELVTAFNNKRIDGFGNIHPRRTEEIWLDYQAIEKFVPQYYAIFMNKNTARSLQDPDVVRALSFAIDKEKIIADVFAGNAIAVQHPILPFIEGYREHPGQEYSTARAIELFEQEGWRINEETGVREKGSGNNAETLRFTVIVPQVGFLIDTIKIIKNDWREIGVELNEVVLNPSDIVNEVLKTRNYQMLIFGNSYGKNPDIFSFWHSSERFYPGMNLSLYERRAADDLLESVRRNFDAESRAQELAELQNFILEDMPALFLYSPRYTYVAPRDFGGFQEEVIRTPSDRFRNVHRWYTETTRTFR